MKRLDAAAAALSALVGVAGGVIGTALLADQLSVFKGERGEPGEQGEQGARGSQGSAGLPGPPGESAENLSGGVLLSDQVGGCPLGTRWTIVSVPITDPAAAAAGLTFIDFQGCRIS